MWFCHLKLDLLQKKDKKVLQQWNEYIEFFHNRDEKLVIHKSLDGHATLKSEGSTVLAKMKNKARPNECVSEMLTLVDLNTKYTTIYYTQQKQNTRLSK